MKKSKARAPKQIEIVPMKDSQRAHKRTIDKMAGHLDPKFRPKTK